MWSVHALNEVGGVVFPSSFDVYRYPFDSRWRETFKEVGLMSVDALRPAVFLCLELFHPNRVSRVRSSPQLNFPSELWNLPHWNPGHISAHEFQRNADIRLSLFYLRLFIYFNECVYGFMNMAQRLFVAILLVWAESVFPSFLSVSLSVAALASIDFKSLTKGLIHTKQAWLNTSWIF